MDLAKSHRLDVTSLLQVPVNSKEWESKEKAKGSKPSNSKRNSLGLDWEWQVGVDSRLGSAKSLIQGSGRNLKVSGGLGSSQSKSRNHNITIMWR